MSARWDDDVVDEQPVSYTLTVAGWAAARETTTLTVQEAAALHRTNPKRIRYLLEAGDVEALKVDGVWLIDGASLAARVAAPRRSCPTPRRLDAGPLLRQVALRGGPAACGVEQHSGLERAYVRALESRTLTVGAADMLAVRLLGLTLWDLWGELT